MTTLKIAEEKLHSEPSSQGFLNRENFHRYSQKLIEDYYLQPLEECKKENLKDGYVEREIHGAMHAARVSIYVLILHQIIKKQFPKFVQDSLEALKEKFGFDETELLLLTRYVALGHDSARKDEGFDKWEKESSEFVKDFLVDNGIKEKVADLFSKLAEYKDKPDKLDKLPDASKALDYLRCLVSLADNFDIIRCHGKFEFSFIEKTLQAIEGYNSEAHAPIFFNFAKQVYKLLKNQQDLYFETKLIGPNDEVYQLPKGEADFSIRAKVGIEHAHNALSVTVALMRKYLYFEPFLREEIPENSELSQVTPVFNPFIHGSNSKALILMSRTGYQLLSPIEMLEKHSSAPFSGEISGGGLFSPDDRCNPCFGRLRGKGNSMVYSLKKIIETFTKTRLRNRDISKANSKLELEKALKDGPKYLYRNINSILIHAARYRQLGGDVKSLELIQCIQDGFQGAVGILYLYIFLFRYLVPNNEGYDDLTDDQQLHFEQVRGDHYESVELIKKIKASKLDLETLYKNPTEEDCKNVLKLLRLPSLDSLGREAIFESTMPFKVAQLGLEQLAKQKKTRNKFRIGGYLVNDFNRHTISELWGFLVERGFSTLDTSKVEEEILNYIQTLKSRFKLLDHLLALPQSELVFNEKEQAFLDDPIPIVFVYPSDSYMQNVDMRTQEYRAQKPLQLGRDITMLATKTPGDAKRLYDYLQTNCIYGVEIVLFEQLEKSKLTGVKPKPHIKVEELLKGSAQPILGFNQFSDNDENPDRQAAIKRLKIQADQPYVKNDGTFQQKSQSFLTIKEDFEALDTLISEINEFPIDIGLHQKLQTDITRLKAQANQTYDKNDLTFQQKYQYLLTIKKDIEEIDALIRKDVYQDHNINGALSFFGSFQPLIRRLPDDSRAEIETSPLNLAPKKK